jgi:hypothetical protein
LEPDPAVFLLSDQVYEALSLPFIDRALCPQAQDQLVIHVKSATGEGFITPAGTLRRTVLPSYPEGAIEAFRSLKAEFAVHFGSARPNEGLSKPQLEIEYGSSWKVAVGHCDKLRGQEVCYARRSDVSATFAISAHSAHLMLRATRYDP